MLTSVLHPGTYEIRAVAVSLLLALCFGILIGVLFRATHPEGGGLCAILCVLPFLVASVILIVNGNLGTSVAVLGAFGLVRFRSAPGTAEEIGYLFYAMVVGLATGMGFLSLAAVIFLVAGLGFLVLHRLHFSQAEHCWRVLRITIPEDLNYRGLFDDLFYRYTRRADLERVRTTNMGTMYELTYRIRMRDAQSEKELMDAIRCRNGNLSIVWGVLQREKNEF